MVQAILKTQNPVSSDKLDLLMSLTEGNPFFVEEITKSLVQAGVPTDQWNLLRFPPSIQHTVQHRAEKLPERTRQVLALASVFGERFDFTLLQEVAGEDEQTLLQILKELIAAQLIVEQTADQYKFRHALTREVVYTSLMLREREAMHHRIGQTIERLALTHRNEPVAPLAYHFYQAGEWQKAMEYSQRAGEKAQALYAPREALAHFSHALEAAQQLGIPEPLPSLRGRGQARSILGDFDGARADYDTLIELARRTGDQYSVWQALMDLGYSWQPRDMERAGEYFQQALQLARTVDDASILAQTLNREGNWNFYRSQPREALLLHAEALEIFQKLGDRRGMAQTLELLGMASYGVGAVIQGVAYYEQAIPLLREMDDRQGLVRALEFLSLRARLDTEVLGEVILSELASYAEQAFEIAHSYDWREGEGEALSRAGICWDRAGDYAHGLELLLRAQSIGEEIEHRHLLASVHLILGEWYLDLLVLDQARQHLELAFTLAKEVGAFQLLKTVPPALVSTCVLQSDIPRAKAVLSVLSLTDDVGEIEKAGMFERLCWSAQVELELALDHPKRALEIVDHLIGSAQNLAEFGPFAIPWLSQLRAQALAALGRSEEAIADLEGAQATARARGAQPLLWRLHSDLGNVYHTLGRRHDAEQEFSAARDIIQDLAKHVPEGTLRQNFLHRALEIIPATHIPTPRQELKREFGGLTAREREIAGLIARGKSNREIATELVISEKTVERHIANIMVKLGFNARTQIAVWVVEKGLNK
jgi:DNA-binding CsgD family transcriptional regulator